MSVVIKKELDPVYEVLGLLYLSNQPQWKEKLKKELPSYGIEPEGFYQKHFKILEKYLKTFQKYKTSLPQEETLFGGCLDEMFFLVYAAMGTEQRELLEQRDSLDEEKLRRILAVYLSDRSSELMDTICWEDPRFELPDEAAIIKFVNGLDYKSEEKWHLLELLCNPGYWYGQLFDLIEVNIPAYEKAREAVAKPLEKLLQDQNQYGDEEFLKIVSTFTRDVTMYAALALPMTQFVLYTNCYQGLFCSYLTRDTRDSGMEAGLLGRQLKALADKSKMDILRELKKESRYNLELAERLKLSPSTTSHHMNALLFCGFVSVDKVDGKVYYSLNQKNIELFLQKMRELLL